MAHSHPHQKQPQEYPSPLGNEHQCNEANSQAKALIQLAREAWYSLNPPIKIRSGKEYRKHPMYDNYYFLEEFQNSGVYAIERKMSGIMTAIKVRSGEQRLNRDGEEMLDSFIATQPKDINRDWMLFDESFTTRKVTSIPQIIETPNLDKRTFRHRCFDGSVKELRLDPNPQTRLESPKKRYLDIYLSPASKAFVDQNGPEVIKRLWRGFEAHENSSGPNARHIAFKHLERIIEQTSVDGLQSFTTHVGFSLTKTWYCFVPDSHRFFRRAAKNHIEEITYRTKVTGFCDPGVGVQASLSHRKAEMYGFAGSGSENRF
ncbi:hypothetical protein JCM5353_004349 [Sporobolomyces roseus]